MKKATLAVLSFALVGAIASVPASAGTLYSNGPGNYTVDAWTLNYGYVVTDSFTIAANSTATSATFDVWAFPGDTLSSVDWSIGSSPYSGATTTAAASGAFIETNGYGYDIYTETISLGSLDLSAGTYYFTLQNANVPNGDPIYWDENDGPSTAYESATGQIGSETFTIDNSSPVIPEPSSLLLMGSGLLSFAGMMRRKLKA